MLHEKAIEYAKKQKDIYIKSAELYRCSGHDDPYGAKKYLHHVCVAGFYQYFIDCAESIYTDVQIRYAAQIRPKRKIKLKVRIKENGF